VDDLVNNRQNRKDAARPEEGKQGSAQATQVPPQPQPAAKEKPGGFLNKLFGG